MATPLLNRKHLRKYALDTAEKLKYHVFTGVREDFYEAAEDALRVWVRNFVRTHPSKGKYLTTGVKKERKE